jgi:hypothetical protein
MMGCPMFKRRTQSAGTEQQARQQKADSHAHISFVVSRLPSRIGSRRGQGECDRPTALKSAGILGEMASTGCAIIIELGTGEIWRYR